MPDEPDYRELLKRYLAYMLEFDGSTHFWLGCKGFLTEKEIELLQALEEEIEG